ncbi:MAG TPA: hypothetical protein VGP73_18220 [Thermoanaerobaculia bacterium]
MKNVARLLLLLIVLLAASAVPSRAIIPNCWEFCPVECPCDLNCSWGCWDINTSSGTNCGDWSAGSGLCGNAP